jgi:hypothetical protein
MILVKQVIIKSIAGAMERMVKSRIILTTLEEFSTSGNGIGSSCANAIPGRSNDKAIRTNAVDTRKVVFLIFFVFFIDKPP